MFLELYIAKRYLLSKRKTRFLSLITVIAVGGVWVGVTALTVVLSVMDGLQDDLRDKILGVNAHVQVLKFHRELIDNSDELLSRIRSIDKVKAAAPFVYTEALLHKGKEYSEGVIVWGVVPELEREVTGISQNMYDGSFDFNGDNEEEDRHYPGIVLGHLLADRMRVFPGDVVTLYSPFNVTLTPLGPVNKQQYFRVVGVFQTGMFEYDSKFVYISLADAQEFLGMDDQITGVGVRISDIYKAPEIAGEITVKLGYPYRTNNWIGLNRNLFSALKLEKVAMFVILTLIVLVASFNIISTLIMVVTDKTKEIGIMRSMGMTSKSVMRIFMLDGMVVGIVGTLLGCITGYILAYLLDTYKFISLPGDVYFIDTLPVSVGPINFFMVALASLTISFLATIYPAYQASRMDPVEAIRYE